MRFCFALLAVISAVASTRAVADPLDDGKDHSAELGKAMEDAVAATPAARAEFLKKLVLPDAATWFARAFGEKAGALGSKEYEEIVQDIGRLEDYFSEAAKAGASKATVSRWTTLPADDPAGATEILNAMKVKMSLYSVVLVRPDGAKTENTFDIGFFVWSAGSARIVGECEGAVVRETDCLTRLKNVGICAALHEATYKTYPSTISLLLDRSKKTNFAVQGFNCPCSLDEAIGYKWVFPVAGDGTPGGDVLAWCPKLHAGKRLFVTFQGASLNLPEAEFAKKLSAQYAAARKLIPERREAALRRAAGKQTDEQKKENDEYLQGLDIVEAEAKALLDAK